MMNNTGERITEMNEVKEDIDGPKVQAIKKIKPVRKISLIIQRPSLITFTCLFLGKRDKNNTKCMIAKEKKFNVVYFCAIHWD